MFLGRTLHVLCVAWLLGHKYYIFCTYRPLKKGVRHSPTFPYRVGSPLSIDTKIMKISQRMTSQWPNKAWPTWKCRSSAKYRPKLIFALNLKISKYRNITRFFVYKEGIVFLTYSVSFRFISCRYFSKWWLKIFSGCNHHPYPQTSTAYPTPCSGVPPDFFFHQNDHKGCKRDYLDARGHFVCVLVQPATNR